MLMAEEVFFLEFLNKYLQSDVVTETGDVSVQQQQHCIVIQCLNCLNCAGGCIKS